jgi:hypothetical protein
VFQISIWKIQTSFRAELLHFQLYELNPQPNRLLNDSVILRIYIFRHDDSHGTGVSVNAKAFQAT